MEKRSNQLAQFTCEIANEMVCMHIILLYD